jgi:hypothetical protein
MLVPELFQLLRESMLGTTGLGGGSSICFPPASLGGGETFQFGIGFLLGFIWGVDIP